ncbi:MAG TPA: AraC family transcriptional regulator [Stackebrandtia sp.]|jgi:AraC-like DNA-binding protein|uniref:AraC family transcriptional regulator n=1 Tax=Stackebrandtia sp. TaxID=2023065 RepID=UPI002D4CEE32|nr:AraC family transcriptional regulator [Stackebrandtia sp.]HZE38920.1 AraC family transcriptional regulator [Stackebrandtia sp.]
MTASPGNFADRPAPQEFDVGTSTHDLLSELLRSVRLSGDRIVAYAPPPTFSIGFADTGTLHIVEEGELEIRIDGDAEAKRVGPGDVVLLPRGDRHVVTDAGTTAATRWLCGRFTIGDARASHLLESLPAAIVLHGMGGPALEGLDVARRMIVIEMRSPSQGSAVMVARILDLIFIQILRVWAAGADTEPNWLVGAVDPHTGPALSAIHRDPGRDWTVEELARVCNLSRSAFAERFAAHVGKPPATYLGQVRLGAAADLLRNTSLPVALIAKRVGYMSEAAFSRAFKNRYDTPPAQWRRGVSLT